jgi:hypothetical protein
MLANVAARALAAGGMWHCERIKYGLGRQCRTVQHMNRDVTVTPTVLLNTAASHAARSQVAWKARLAAEQCQREVGKAIRLSRPATPR